MDAINILLYSGAAITISVQAIQNKYIKNKNIKLQKMENDLFLENAELKRHRAHLNNVISEQAETISDLNSKFQNEFFNVEYLKTILAKYQRLNNELCDKIDSLIDKRQFNGKQKKANQTKTDKPIYEFKTKTN